MSLTNLYTKRQRIAKLARTKRGVFSHLRDFLDRRVTAGISYTIRERGSPMKNRMLEIGTSGSVRDEAGQPPHLLGRRQFLHLVAEYGPGRQRDFSGFARLRGGAGRTRTNHQSVMEHGGCPTSPPRRTPVLALKKSAIDGLFHKRGISRNPALRNGPVGPTWTARRRAPG